MLSRMRHVSEKFHMLIHVALSFVVVYVFMLFGVNFTFQEVVILALVSVLPDTEHLVFFGTYGRRSPYTLEALKVLKNEGFISVCKFLAHNHKSSTSLYLHNLATPAVFTFIGAYFVFLNAYLLAAAAFVLSSHYIFDVLEDILMMGKLNPNWIFKFHKPSSFKKKHS